MAEERKLNDKGLREDIIRAVPSEGDILPNTQGTPKRVPKDDPKKK